MLVAFILLLQAIFADSQAQWQLVDAAAVMCPPLAGVPAKFSLSFSLDSLMSSQPYILTVIRASPNQVNFTYQVTDAGGSVLVPWNQVSLSALSSPAPAATCACLAPSLPTSVAATFGANYGSQCGAWDSDNCALWWGTPTVGDWCCKPWCFASSSCPDAFESDLVPGAYISYSACSSTPQVTPCPWTAVAQQADPCACQNVDKILNASLQNVDKSLNASLLQLYGAGYGSQCKAWDSGTCARDNDPWSLGSWCCESWCYVSAACPSAQYSYARGMNNTLPWSSARCISDPQTVAQCPMATPEQLCQCLNVTMPSAQLPAGAASDFGQRCKVHNSNLCQQGANRGIWCCLPWCWVSANCPFRYESSDWPGRYYSTIACDPDLQALATCPYSSACQCQSSVGQPPLPQGLPANYGSSCWSWDSDTCNVTWGNTSLWASSSLDWCCDIWCFVDSSCPLTAGPRNILLGTRTFSTAVCGDAGNLSYQLSTNSCVPDATLSRRLAPESGKSLQSQRQLMSPRQQQPPSDAVEDLLELPGHDPEPRELVSKSSSIYRRRTSSPRRRRVSSPRRRTVSASRPTPTWSGAVSTDVRRRTTAIGKVSSFSTDRRRALGQQVYKGTSLEYGYTTKSQLLQNYGTMPYQTSYGFSGYGAYPASYRPNVVFGSALGLGTGAAIGFVAGSYYESYASSSLYWRRRRSGSFEWCVVPSSDSVQAGSLMECWDCSARYGAGACLKASACYSAAGCGLQLTSAMHRDDLANSGFLVSDWISPITVSIVNMSGLNRSNLCPQTRENATSVNGSMILRPELFLTLTIQSPLSPALPCDNILGTPCNTSCYGSNQVCVASTAGRRACICQDGSCVQGSGFTASCVTSYTSASIPARTTSCILACLLLAVAS